MSQSDGAESPYGEHDKLAPGTASGGLRGYFIGLVLSLLLTAASLSILGNKLWVMYHLGSMVTPTTAVMDSSAIR